MLANTLNTSRFRIRANAAALATSQDQPGTILRVFRVARIIQQIRRDRQGEYLPQERDRLLTHRVGIAHVRFDYFLEGFINALQRETSLNPNAIHMLIFQTFLNFSATIH